MEDGRERLRIVHVTQPTSGGVAQVVADLARAQRADGHDVAVVCPADPAEAEAEDGDRDGFASRLLRDGVRTVAWEATRSPGRTLAAETRALAHTLARVFADESPDLVHLHSSKAGLAGRLALRGRIATVFQPHAWSFEAVEGVMRFASLRWERWGARWADRIVCVSEAEQRLGADLGVAARWTVVRNGVDMMRFFPPNEGGTASAGAVSAGAVSADMVSADAVVNPHSDGPLVVAVGRLCRQKGQDVLLTAWPLVLERFGTARLALVGDGPDAARLARMIADDPRLQGQREDRERESGRGQSPAAQLVGAVGDPRSWYWAADLVVLPSRWEAMALVPLEASACGRLIVASDVAGVRESLPPERAPWAVVPPGDPRALAAALVSALTAAAADPAGWVRAGRQVAEYARKQHDFTRTAADISDVYIQVLRERAHAGGALRQRTPE